ncbi:hypothetical protein GOP47_0030215 [Adiantum capillus-veneris]|nr:hypothetical protein GOP47_0030215 [Adiantum capillus-veneris]
MQLTKHSSSYFLKSTFDPFTAMDSVRGHRDEMQVHSSLSTTHLLASPWPGSLRRREVTVSIYPSPLTSLHAFSPHLSLFTLKFQSDHHISRLLPNIFSASYSGSETSAREQEEEKEEMENNETSSDEAKSDEYSSTMTHAMGAGTGPPF